jgi:hypothetical protein
MSTLPEWPAGPSSVHGVPVAKVHEMVFATALGLLALFSLISLALGTEDPRSSTDPRDNPLLWATMARR